MGNHKIQSKRTEFLPFFFFFLFFLLLFPLTALHVRYFFSIFQDNFLFFNSATLHLPLYCAKSQQNSRQYQSYFHRCHLHNTSFCYFSYHDHSYYNRPEGILKAMALLIFTKREFLLKEEKLIFLKNYYTMKIFKDYKIENQII